MIVMRTTEPTRGLSLRDTKYIAENIEVIQTGRRTGQIKCDEVDGGVYSPSQKFEDVRVKCKRQFIHNLIVCQTERGVGGHDSGRERS